MKKHNKYRLLLYKKYIDTGLYITSYLKALIMFFGFYAILKSDNIKLVLIVLFFYLIACFFVGWAFFRYGWAEQEQEVSNNYNPFVKKMISSVKRKA